GSSGSRRSGRSRRCGSRARLPRARPSGRMSAATVAAAVLSDGHWSADQQRRRRRHDRCPCEGHTGPQSDGVQHSAGCQALTPPFESVGIFYLHIRSSSACLYLITSLPISPVLGVCILLAMAAIPLDAQKKAKARNLATCPDRGAEKSGSTRGVLNEVKHHV